MQKLTTGRWLARHLLVLVVAIVLINFGFWQLRRLDEKRARNADILATLQQPAIILAGDETSPDDLHLHRVQVSGTFDHSESMIVRNRSFNNTPGDHVLTPLRISGSDKAVLVDRGWLPRDQSAPDRRAAYNLPGQVTIEGIAYRTQTRPSSLAPLDRVPDGQTRLDAWFRVDIDMIQKQLPYPLLPIFITQSPGPDTNPNALPQPAGNVKLDEGSHLSYALQWFSFAIVLVIIYSLFIRQGLRGDQANSQ